MIRKALRVFRPRSIVFVTILFAVFHFMFVNNSVKRHRRNKPVDFFKPLSRNLIKDVPNKQVIVLHNSSKQPLQSSNHCHSQRHVVFLKTHKTGSTTINNIMLRYAERHQLSVGLPPRKMWELAGYPDYFDSKLITPTLKKYDLLCHHFRYKDSEVRKVTYPDSKFVTILRDPANEFESGFWFFRDWPYTEWLHGQKNSKSLEYFLNNTQTLYNHETPWYFRAKNYQAFDLGLENDESSKAYIQKAIKWMEKNFHLVLLTEYFEESLILLKDLLCMEFDDIVHLRLKVRQDIARTNATSRMKEQMREWNKLDFKIYEHFEKILSEKIRDFGTEKMQLEVAFLQRLLNKTEQSCVKEYDQYDMKPWISRIKLVDKADEKCQKLSWGEVKYGDYIRMKQTKYVKANPNEQLSYEEQKRLLKKAQKRVLGEERIPINEY